MRITQVHGSNKFIRGLHHPYHALQQIIHVLKTAGLHAVAKNGNGFILQGLNNEVGYDPPVVGMHAGAVGVEDANDPDVDLILPVVVEKQTLCTALTLVVARPNTNGINVAPVIFGLGVYQGVAINFAGRCLKNFRLNTLGQSQHIYGTHHRGLYGFDGVVLIMYGRSRTGQVVNLVYLYKIGVGNIVPHQFKVGVVEQMNNVSLASGKVIIETDDFIDRKSTRLNSSHVRISYAVFCLKKKKKKKKKKTHMLKDNVRQQSV